MVYVLIGYDEDWYTFETFLGVFSSREKAQEYADNDYDVYNGEKIFEHEEYKIYPVKIDVPMKYNICD